MKKTIHVAVGIVFNSNNQILIAKRPDTSHQGGLWEFPGGKVEQGESILAALVRELKEEVGIDIHAANAFMQVHHDYGDKVVLLDVWCCEKFSGVAIGMEGQQVEWVNLSEINNYTFPDANKKIIENIEK